jgi:small multidrug resistance pump
MWLTASLLGLAIVVEVGATAALPRTSGFTQPAWTAFVVSGYALSIWLLALVVRHIPVSVAYAVWSGAGTALVAAAGLIFLGERLDLVKAAGLAAIIGGVVAVNLSAGH